MMRGDFSRRTFRPQRRYTRVLLQQGRVILDADWNEQAELQLQLSRQMMRDLVGPHGGPEEALGFYVSWDKVNENKIQLSVTNGSPETMYARGRYYINGLLLEHEHPDNVPLIVQTDISPLEVTAALLVYLEAWERHLTWIEENLPFVERSMREVALGGPDTASRSELRWRVRALPLKANSQDAVDEALQALAPVQGTLAASLTTADIGPGDPCRDTAEDRYRGPENRLYRVEIHAAEVPEADPPTFKWSRENGSVVYAVKVSAAQTFEGRELVLELMDLGRDDRYRLRRGQVVELVTAESDEAGEAGPLLEVVEVDEDTNRVKLQQEAEGTGFKLSIKRWALLRRWDQPHKPKKKDGSTVKPVGFAIPIVAGEDYLLEDGIVVRFERPKAKETSPEGPPSDLPFSFQPSDYWLIPARTIPGNIEWPRQDGGAGVPEPPHGVERSFAPLALFNANGDKLDDLRKKWKGLTSEP